MCVSARPRSHEEAGGGGDPDQVPQQDPGELRLGSVFKVGWVAPFQDSPLPPGVCLTSSAPPLPPAGHHRALRAREVPPPAGQDQVPGAARAHHDPVHHHHQVKNPDQGREELVPWVSWSGVGGKALVSSSECRAERRLSLVRG